MPSGCVVPPPLERSAKHHEPPRVFRVYMKATSEHLGAIIVTTSICLAVPACSGTVTNLGASDAGHDSHDSGGSRIDAAQPGVGDATAPEGSATADGLAGGADVRTDAPRSALDGTPGDSDAASDGTSGDDSGDGEGIACGNARCSAPGEFCCVSPSGVQSCSANANDCLGQGNTPVCCSTSSQCPAPQLCCGEQHSGYYADVSCQLECNGSNNGVSQIQFCAASTPDCPANTSCQASVYLIGFSVCE